MRRQIPIAHALYNHLFPHPTPSDPPSFAAHLARNLVPEVRIEVATYYGDLNSVEARYPGLNYCYAPHRMRLGRFKHHRRLFQAFDELGLTYQEIQDFCCWEGSRWARLKYEEDQGEKVLDTTGDEIRHWNDRTSVFLSEKGESITRKTDIEIVFEDASSLHGQPADLDTAMNMDHHRNSSLASQIDRQVARRQSGNNDARRILTHLNQRVRHAMESGEAVPAEIEAIIKEHMESGTMDNNTWNLVASARSYLADQAQMASSVRQTAAGQSAAASWNYDTQAAA